MVMVATTVILAAVFGSFLFWMGSDTKKQSIVLVTASHLPPDRIVITYYGGPDPDPVVSINVTVNGLQVDDDSDSATTSAIAGVDPGYALTILNTSDTDANNGIANLNGGNLTITNGRDHVTVVARFTDGSDLVILDTYV